LSFDIDCLDPAFAPGTGTPVPGGLSSAQALDILRRLVPTNLIGMDVVEVAPRCFACWRRSVARKAPANADVDL
jgi:arginase family enzyme